MTKKDFVVIVRILRSIRKDLSVRGFKIVVSAFTLGLTCTNPLFDEKKFLKAIYEEPKDEA